MPMPHRTQQQLIKRRLVGKGRRRADPRAPRDPRRNYLAGYRNGPYADLRKWVEGEIEAARTRKKVVHRDSIAVRRKGAAQVNARGSAERRQVLAAAGAIPEIQIRTGDYAFTTTRPVAATTRLGEVLVQLVEIPGLIEGLRRPRGRPRAARRAPQRGRDRVVSRLRTSARGARDHPRRSGRRRDRAAGSPRRDQGRRGSGAEASRAARRSRVGARRRESRAVTRGALGADGPRPHPPARRRRPGRA